MEGNAPTSPGNFGDTPHKPSRSLGQKIAVWAIVLLVFGGLFYWVLRPQGSTQAGGKPPARPLVGGPVTVMTATAKQGDIGVYQEAIGTVTPVFTSSITSQVTGVIYAVHYKEGQHVRKGDPLIDIDSRPFEAQLAQAQGTLDKDKHLLEQSRMDLERYRAAWARNAVAKQTLDDQEKLVAQNEATVRADEGAVRFDQVQLSYCHIVAPFNGRVGLRLVDPGNVVQSNGTSALVVVTQEDPTTVIFTLAEDALDQLQTELRGGHTLSVDAYDRTALTRIATGKLQSVDNQVDTTTGTVKLRAVFSNKNRVFFPNQFVNTRLLLRTLKGVTLIPSSTIQRNGQVSFVYVIQQDGTAQMRNVKAGATDAGLTSVEGVQPGEVVANSSFEKLQPNAKVKIAQATPPANPGGSSAK